MFDFSTNSAHAWDQVINEILGGGLQVTSFTLSGSGAVTLLVPAAGTHLEIYRIDVASSAVSDAGSMSRAVFEAM